MTEPTLGNANHTSVKPRKPPQLHAVNAIRVVAEYFVVRHHILPSHLQKGDYDEHAHGPIGVDIMSFFFVLSGFVLMYSFERTDFSTWQSKREFILGRITKLYPIFLLNWMFALPKRIIDPEPAEQTCWTFHLCPVLQLVMLDSWFGCGYNFALNGISWFLSCLFWMWFVFPFIKDHLITYVFRNSYIWPKLMLINTVWGLAFIMLWDYDIYTVAPFPLLRFGEFLIGCGAALAPESWFITGRRYWIPFTLVIILYNLERVEHGMLWLCLREDAAHSDCSLWRAGQKQLDDIRTPCITVLEKIVNKYAVVWACLIHGIARDELSFLTASADPSNPPPPRHWTLRVLHTDVFKFLSKFSPTLYLSHLNMYYAVIFLGQYLVGWVKNKWRDDTLLFAVYVACYSLQNALTWILDRLSQLYSHQSTRKGEEDHEPLVVNDARA
jgi:peptidoglycan/LPS O-acetylase OafA/YrhL